jgi:hypothetical protein
VVVMVDDEEEVLELDVEGFAELELMEEVLELDAEGDVEPELWAEAVLRDEVLADEVFEVLAFDTASVRFFATAVVVAFVVEDEVDLTTFVRPVAISAVSTARPAVETAAIVLVRRLIRRVAAARARRCRVCSSFMETMEPPPSGTRLPASCESSVRGRGVPRSGWLPLFGSVCPAAAHSSSRRSPPFSPSPDQQSRRPRRVRSTRSGRA